MKAICPHCQQHYDVDAEFEGVSTECIYCHKTFTIRGIFLRPLPRDNSNPPAQQEPPKPKKRLKWYQKIFVIFGFLCVGCGFGAMNYAYEAGYGFHADKCGPVAFWFCVGVFFIGVPFCGRGE